jgi:general secretion pathway protein D
MGNTISGQWRKTLMLALAAAQALSPMALGQMMGAPVMQPATQPTTMPATTAPTTAPTAMVTTVPGDGLLLNFKDASIDSVLDQLSAVAGFIVVRQTPVSGRITLESKQPVSREEAVSLLNTVLNTNGYAAIQMGRILKIMTTDAAKKADIPVHVGSEPSDIADTDELITQVIPIRYADAVQLKTDLTPLINSNADVTANASSNTIIVTDKSSNIRRLVQIISSMDTHLATSADVRVFQLKFAAASSAAKLINDVFAQSTQIGNTQTEPGGGFNPFSRFRGFGGGGFGGGGFGGGGFGRGGGAPGGAASTGGQAQQRKEIPVVADSDDRTNTVVVSGPTDTLDVVTRVLKELDANPAVQQSIFVYNLQNGNCDDLANVLNALINGTSLPSTNKNTGISSVTNSASRGGSSGSAGGSSSFGGGTISRSTPGGGSFSGGGGAAGGIFGRNGANGLSTSAESSVEDLEGQAVVVPNDDTNSLLIMTAPKNYDRIKLIIDELDRPVAQVLIKVLIAEVTHENTADIGVEISNINLNATGTGQFIGTDSQVTTPPLAAPGTTAGALNPGFGETGANGGFVARIVGTDATATLRALATNNDLDVLSRPYILTSDNQLASVIVGQSVPIPSNSRVTDDGQVINSLTYQNVGIILNVTPHINPAGLVTLDVDSEVSSLSGQTVAITTGLGAPIINTNSAQNEVAIPDGQTIVIGGMMSDNKTQEVQKVPLLGDIPLLGLLFQRNTSDKTKTELLFFLTPHVATRPAYLSAMSKDEEKGMKLVPNAIQPGTFQEYMRNMQRGTTQPTTEPATMPTSKHHHHDE